MSEPTPVTTSNIVLLSGSRVKARGTLKMPGKSIQVRSAARIFGSRKMRQLQTKLARTAAMEMKLLRGFDLRVNKVMAPAEPSGAIRIIQGRFEVIDLARE
jgi:hypothetical protein